MDAPSAAAPVSSSVDNDKRQPSSLDVLLYKPAYAGSVFGGGVPDNESTTRHEASHAQSEGMLESLHLSLIAN